MKKIFIKAGLLMAIVFSLAACNNTETDSKELAEDSNEAKFDTKAGENQAEFVVDAVASNSAEVNLAQLAIQRSGNAEVKEFAAMLEKEHTTLTNELKTLAESKAITVPVELSEDAKEDYKALSDTKPENFDKKWAKEMVDKHESTIDKYEKEWKKTTDPELKQWIETTLPKIKAHHEKAKALHDKLK